MIIFARTFDLLKWLLERCEKFPKSQRFVVTQRLQGALLDFNEAIYEANARNGPRRVERLEAADAALNKIRSYLRLAHDLDWLTAGQLQHVSVMVAEVGALLGGWLKQSRRDPSRSLS